MKITITNLNKPLIENLLIQARGAITYTMLQETAESAEKRFDTDGYTVIPENKRVGTKITKVYSCKQYSFSYTLLRLQNGLWAITSLQYEPVQPEVLICPQ